VAILTSERDGKGTLFVGSTSERVPASDLVRAVASKFGGKGGGNPASATAVGEPGAPLGDALRSAVEEARRLAGA
jgi:alanyl-tRNA synthetase